MYVGDVQALQVLSNHTSDINSVDFAGDNILVTGSGDKNVRVWEWKTGTGFVETSFSPLLGHKYGVTSVKVSPQFTMLASASIDGTTQLWNLRSGSKIHTMVQPGGEAVRICKFSPDSSLLVTAGDNGQACLWDLVRRTLIRCFQKHEGAVQSVSFTPDSDWLLTSCTLSVLQLFSTNEIIDSCPSINPELNVIAQVDDAHDLGVVCCDFSSAHKITCTEPLSKMYNLVTCGNDSFVKLWNVEVKQYKYNIKPICASINLFRIMEKHSSALTCVRFCYNGFYSVSSGLDKTVVIWEMDTGKAVSVLTGHNRYVACCAFSKNGSFLATGSNDKKVIIWDVMGTLSLDSELVRVPQKSFSKEPTNEQFFHESVVIKYAENSGSEVKLIQKLSDHNGAVNSVTMFGNCLIASGSGDKLVRVWNRKHNKDNKEELIYFQEMIYSPLDGHKYSINYVEFSPCGTKLASCSMDGTTVIWDVESGSQTRTSFVNSGSAIRVCRWSPDGSKIATAGDDEKTILWNLETVEELSVFEGHSDSITAVAFTPDSLYLVTACSEGAWRLFACSQASYENAALVCDHGHDLGVQDCDFSPITETYSTTGSEEANANSIWISYLLATCGNDSLINLWKICAMGNELHQEENIAQNIILGSISYQAKRQLIGHGGNVMCVRFSPVNGKILGSVATDRTARLWSVHTGTCLHVLENHDSLVTTCAFSADTSLFLTGALDKIILIWQLPEQLVSQSILFDHMRNNRKKIADWSLDDVIKWLHEIDLSNLVKGAQTISLNGQMLLSVSDESIIGKLLFLENDIKVLDLFRKQLYWLKCEDMNTSLTIEDKEIPDDYLCPITHEVMRDPVQCSDGFTYERAAINEWFLCGKFTSPLTNEPLKSTILTTNVLLRNAIFTYLYGNGPCS